MSQAGSLTSSGSGPITFPVTVAQGGTGAVTLTNHGVLIGQGTSPIIAISSGNAGQVLQSGGAAADPLYSIATYPSIATTTGTILRADGSNWVKTTTTYPNTVAQASYLYGSASNVISALAPTTLSGGFPTYDGTNGVWFNPLQYIYEWDDFIAPQNNSSDSKLSWNRVAANGGGVTQDNTLQDNARPGIRSLNISIAASSAGGLTLYNAANSAPYLFGGGNLIINFLVKIPIVSDGTDTFTVRIGMNSSITGTLGSNAVLFSYNSGVNGGNWQIITNNNNLTTTVNTSTAADINWHRFTINIDASASNAHFFIDGLEVSGSPITTNIPTTQPNISGPCVSILRTAGTTNTRNILFDLFTIWQALTVSR